MAAMGVSQRISSPVHELGQILDLGFTAGQVDSDLAMKEIKIPSLSRTDHFLVQVKLIVVLCRVKGTHCTIFPQKLMDPSGFLEELRDSPIVRVGN